MMTWRERLRAWWLRHLRLHQPFWVPTRPALPPMPLAGVEAIHTGLRAWARKNDVIITHGMRHEIAGEIIQAWGQHGA